MRRCAVVLLLLAAAVPGSLRADVMVFNFEGFPDSTSLTTQYPGPTFSNTTVISAGITLNEFELPPHSGTNVVFDDGGPMTISFANTVLRPALQNQDVIKMVKAGLDDALILAKVSSSKCQFDTSTDALIQLKQSGASAAFLTFARNTVTQTAGWPVCFWLLRSCPRPQTCMDHRQAARGLSLFRFAPFFNTQGSVCGLRLDAQRACLLQGRVRALSRLASGR